MLSRTASELFWMARYLERAESYARVLDVTWKLSMIPRHSQQSRDLALPLNLSMTHELFQARHARFTMSNLLNFFALDGNNPCSIYSCVEMAWNNAHAVRGSLSAEVWESINATRIELRSLRQQGLGELGSDGFFEWVKERVHLFRGAVIGTLLRNDALSFIGIGTLIERAFATTQLLLIKDQQLTNDPDPVREYYRLDTLLNAVSAREAYNSLYRQPVSRETVMELLILRNDIPRSLRASIADLVGELEKIANDRSYQPLRLAHQLNVDLRFSTRDDLAQADLQTTLNGLLARINALSDSIRQTYGGLMKLVIDHLTRYGYDEEVKFSTQYLRLTPRSTARQTITAWTLTLPDGAAVTTTDGWGNVLHVLTLDNPHKEITIRASGIVDIADEGEETRDEEAELLSPLVFLRCTPLTRADTAIREFAQRLYRPDAAEESLNQLMADLLLRMPYSPGATQVQDSAADAFARAKGVCQDHTHVFLACCRALEIPARYVSGYVYSDNAQHVAMHAWAEVWLDGRWLSFDITNNTRRLNQHLRLATGLDYLDACPVRGTRLGGGGEIMLTNAEVREHSQQAQQQ
ncbi:hypothetical protein EAN86_07590 [Klebsiella pneumoniae]|nr:hypothetical protein EAN86_07590 [Klebsiella pneumoniae]